MSAPTAKKKAPAKRSAPRIIETAPIADAPMPDVGKAFDDAGFDSTPVILGKKGRAVRAIVPLFTNSAGRKFSMTEPSPLLIFEYLERLRTQGHESATPWFLSQAMGEEARVALATDNDASEEDIARVYSLVSRCAFGAVSKYVEATTGKS